MYASLAGACPLTLIAWRLGGLPLDELWWRYVGLGGNHTGPALTDYLGGHAVWPAVEHNALAQALNEALWEWGCASLVPRRPVGNGWRAVAVKLR